MHGTLMQSTNDQCTGLAPVSVSGILDLGERVLFLCNSCVFSNKRDNLTRNAALQEEFETLKKSSLTATIEEISRTTSLRGSRIWNIIEDDKDAIKRLDEDIKG